jgi:hypothetical protein
VTTSYRIRITTPNWESIQNIPESTILPFTWDASNEGSKVNPANYISFLEKISWPDGYLIVDVANMQLFSEVNLGHYNFNGNVDVILLDNGSARSLNYKYNIRLGIEIKKNIEVNNHNQACMEHFCASSLNFEKSVLTLLTDLNENWVFIYFGSRAKLHKLNTNARAAKFLLENMFNPAKQSELDFPEEFICRLSWNDFVARSGESSLHTFEPQHHGDNNGDKHEEQDKNDSVYPKKEAKYPPKESTNKQNDMDKDMAGAGRSVMLHFGGDVANELDLLDFIDNEDKRTQLVINYIVQTFAPVFLTATPNHEREDLVPFSPAPSSTTTNTTTTTTPSSFSVQQLDINENDACTNISHCKNYVATITEQNLYFHNRALFEFRGKNK